MIDAAVAADPHFFMSAALEQAGLAAAQHEVPVGAVGVVDGKIISRAHNLRNQSSDPTAHAELLVVRDIATRRGDWRLNDVTVVVTLEPCPMCAGALWASRCGGVVFGAADMEAGANGSLYNLGADPRLNHEYEVLGGIEEVACASMLTEFFSTRRT